MKKLFTLLSGTAIILSLCACNSDISIPELKTNPPEKMIKISDGINPEHTDLNYSYDMDSDGTEEIIKINTASDNGQFTEVTIGDYVQKFSVENGTLADVYICDANTNDNLKSLAFITEEAHDFITLRILSYEPGLPAYHFYDESGEKRDFLYMQGIYFNVNEDSSVTLSTCTSVPMGYWEVLRTYSLNDSGVFAENKPKSYKIRHDFNEENYEEWYNSVKDIYFSNKDITEKDREMLSKGYIKAHSKLSADNIVIEEGEYFKAPYDDGKDKVYIEKENGETAWVLYKSEDFGYLNQYFFQTWGF